MKSTRFLVIALIAFAGIVTSTAVIATTKVDVNGPWDDQSTLRLLAIVVSTASMMALAVSAYFMGIGKEASLSWLKVGETYRLVGSFEGNMHRLVVISHVKSGKSRIFDGYGVSVLGRCLMEITANNTKFVWTYTKPWKTEGECGASHGGYEAKIVEDAPPSEEQQLKRLRGSGHETPATSDES